MQKLVNGHLYVFDLTPFTLESGTDAEVIYVQNECVQGYKDLNAEVADKIKGFNQFLLCVNKQEWSQEEGGGDSGDTLYTLTVNCDSTFASLAAGNQFGVVGRCTPDNKPALEGDTGFYTPAFIYDEQNPEQVIGFVVNDMPEGCQFQFDERTFPAGFNLTSSPVLEHGTDDLAGLGQTYVMPASDVTISLSAQEVDPGETEYLSPRITGVNNDVNNFNVGAILNVKDNTALLHAIEFTGHAEQGSTSSLDPNIEYLMGTTFGKKFDENNSAEYFSLCYQSTNDGHKFAIHLANAAGGNYPVNYYTIDSSDFSLEDDHTYRVGLSMDDSDAQTTGIVHILPTFAIDGNTYPPRDVEGNTLNKPAGLDFDISQGTQALVDWVTNFQANVYLFGCVQGNNWGEFNVAGVPFELSTVKVEYTTGADLSQLQIGTETDPWILTATTPNTFNDGIDDWSLSPMRSLVPNTPHIFKLTGNNIHDHVQVNLNGVQQSASAAEWVEGLLVAEGTNILIRALESSDQYTLQSGSINWSNDEQAWYTNMPNEDLEICIDYNGAPE